MASFPLAREIDAKLPDDPGVAASGALRGGAVGRAVDDDEQRGEVPGQGGVDLVPAAVDRLKHPDAGGPIQQGDRGLASEPSQLRHRISPSDLVVTYVAQDVGLNSVAE